MTDDSKNPLVTVICPTYNSKATLRCALRSVLNQDFTDFEVRVMGDACTDGTEEVIAELNDPRLIWFNLPKNTGCQSGPNNEGLRRARGRYMAFIGHDDLWLPWHLSRLVKRIEETGADLVHDLVANIAPEGVDGVYGPPHKQMNYARILFPPSSWLHRQELPGQIGFWRRPAELPWAIDYDFTRRVAEGGKKIAFLPSLGVLKFHSIVWQAYSRKGEPPQKEYLRGILETPKDFAEKILSELAAQYAQNSQWQDKKTIPLACAETARAAKGALKAFLRELTCLYGKDRWPVGPLARWRLQRIRSKKYVIRGLASFTKNKLRAPD
jgi:glycosyltransferase involved in cell wall biosynthesis